MNAKPKIVLGTLDAVAANRANVRTYRSAEFREALVTGMCEAKNEALSREVIERLEVKIAAVESSLTEVRPARGLKSPPRWS